MESLKDKVFVVTGGSGNLGRAIARALARDGAKLALVARSAEPLQSAAEEARALGATAIAAPADLTSDDDVRRMVDVVREGLGGVDGLVNNFGLSMRGTALDTPVAEYRRMLELNFLSAVRTTQALAPEIVQRRGHVVNIGSLASKSAGRWLGAYPASKSALGSFTQQLRLELAAAGVHVALVCPGPIASDQERSYGAEEQANLPEAARRPGAGVKTKAIAADELARRIVLAIRRRDPEIVLPFKARLLFAVQQLSPRLGEWILGKLTG